MEIRLDIDYGGDGTTHGVSVIHDTGSDIMSILDIDLARMGNMQAYNGFLGEMSCLDAGGRLEDQPTLSTQVRFVDAKFVPWSGWIDEDAIVRRAASGVNRLSGSGIRWDFIFATPKGNSFVAVSTNKAGINALI